MSAPTLPAEAKGASEASAKAFVRHWIATLNYAGPSLRGEVVRGLSAQSCEVCMAIADFIDEIGASGGSIEGAGWDAHSIEVVLKESKSSLVIDALVTVHPQAVRPSASAAPKRFDGGRRLKTFWVRLTGGGWKVARLDQPE